MTTQRPVAGMTDTGKQRERNEDHFLVDSSSNGQTQLLAVADGLGGYVAGELASAIAIQTLAGKIADDYDSFLSEANDDPRSSVTERLRDAVLQCNQQILDIAFSDPHLSGMATTLTAALIHEGHAWIAHAGDSRCYLLRDTELIQLTTDHNLSTLLDRGDRFAGENSMSGHVLWNCLGGSSERDVEVDVVQCTLHPNDRLMLCTDGLFCHVKGSEIVQILNDSCDAETACRRLVSLANERGGSDNITIVIAQPDEEPTKVDPMADTVRMNCVTPIPA